MYWFLLLCVLISLAVYFRESLRTLVRALILSLFRFQLRRYVKKAEIFRLRREKEFNRNQLKDEIEGYVDVADECLLEGMYCIIHYSKSDEDLALDQKYKTPLSWSGPFVKGVGGRMRGFVFRVYPHGSDHDRHFHVIDREQGIDARFSFPEIKLQSNKNIRNLIGKGQVKMVKEYLKDQGNFERLGREFVKMGYSI
ncbi:MAG: hypothetical protein AAB391_01845 [Patescibacteria group bacterium]